MHPYKYDFQERVQGILYSPSYFTVCSGSFYSVYLHNQMARRSPFYVTRSSKSNTFQSTHWILISPSVSLSMLTLVCLFSGPTSRFLSFLQSMNIKRTHEMTQVDRKPSTALWDANKTATETGNVTSVKQSNATTERVCLLCFACARL